MVTKRTLIQRDGQDRYLTHYGDNVIQECFPTGHGGDVGDEVDLPTSVIIVRLLDYLACTLARPGDRTLAHAVCRDRPAALLELSYSAMEYKGSPPPE